MWRGFVLFIILGLSAFACDFDMLTYPEAAKVTKPKSRFLFPLHTHKFKAPIQYTKELEPIATKDQCEGACAFNAIASLFEYLGRPNQLDTPISANYLRAHMFIHEMERATKGDIDKIHKLAFVHEVADLATKVGVVSEARYPSHTEIDLDFMVRELNQRLKKFLEWKDSAPAQAVEPERLRLLDYSKQLVEKNFGAFPSDSGVDTMAPLELLERIQSQHKVLPHRILRWEDMKGQKRKEPAELKAVEHGIRNRIDNGLPSIISYAHDTKSYDPSQGLYSTKPSGATKSEELYHIALVVGYRVDDKTGALTHFKILNSHDSHEYLHMPIEYFEAWSRAAYVP